LLAQSRIMNSQFESAPAAVAPAAVACCKFTHSNTIPCKFVAQYVAMFQYYRTGKKPEPGVGFEIVPRIMTDAEYAAEFNDDDDDDKFDNNNDKFNDDNADHNGLTEDEYLAAEIAKAFA
jgi:hypothetical protein